MSGSWYYTWNKHIVKDTAIPEQSHYVVLVFKDLVYTEAGYDANDPPSRASVRVCDYYAFSDKAEWEQMIQEVYLERQKPRGYTFNTDNENVVFFHSSGRGKVSIKVGIDIQEADSASPMHYTGKKT